MRWEAICEQLTGAGYVEFIDSTNNEPFITGCLHSSECQGPTFLHFFGRDIKVKLIARCGSCDEVRDITTEGTLPARATA